jgi:hypothetical protein
VDPLQVSLPGYTYEPFIGKELFEIGLLRATPANRDAVRKRQRTDRIRNDELRHDQ